MQNKSGILIFKKLFFFQKENALQTLCLEGVVAL